MARSAPRSRQARHFSGLPAVVMDVGRGARLAVEHLAGLGHRELVLLAGPRGSWTSREIRRAAVAAAKANNASLVVLGPNPPSEDGGAAAAEQVRRGGATAVLAYNDLMAIGLLEELDRLGVRIPEKISVVGIDDIALSRLTRPKLTTVANPTGAAGCTAVDLLLQRDAFATRASRAGARSIARQDDRRTTAHVTLETELVVRESTGPGPYA